MYCPHQWRICLSASPKFCLLSWYQPKLHDPVSSRRSAEEGVIVPRGLLPPHTIDAANPLASASLSSWFVEDSRPRWHGCRRATLLLRQRLKHRHSSAALLGINPARVCAAGRVRVLCAASRECVEPLGPWRVACVRARASCACVREFLRMLLFIFNLPLAKIRRV